MSSYRAPVLDVVVPVHNEQAVLAAAVGRLLAHLRDTFPYPFRITVADNASTDHTLAVAEALADRHPEVAAVHLAEKGRGKALKAVWSASDAPILAYLDVDLSTDLDALWPLVAPLMSGHSDLAIGTRLARGSRVVRGTKREVISRCYNLVLRATLAARFSDAQCGFKAIRADVAAELLPLVQDTTWFFDTELLVLAERCGLRVAEVPVDWYDDPDSRVDIVATALDDLRGVARLRRAIGSGALPLADIRAHIGRTPPAQSTGSQVVRFAVIGVASTVLHLGLFAALSGALGTWRAQLANVVALLLATTANTAVNRRWTFGVRGRAGAVRHQLQGLLLFALTLGLTALALTTLDGIDPGAGTTAQTVAVALATAVTAVVRFLALRSWITPSAAAAGTGAAKATGVTPARPEQVAAARP